MGAVELQETLMLSHATLSWKVTTLNSQKFLDSVCFLSLYLDEGKKVEQTRNMKKAWEAHWCVRVCLMMSENFLHRHSFINCAFCLVLNPLVVDTRKSTPEANKLRKTKHKQEGNQKYRNMQNLKEITGNVLLVTTFPGPGIQVLFW